MMLDGGYTFMIKSYSRNNKIDCKYTPNIPSIKNKEGTNKYTQQLKKL